MKNIFYSITFFILPLIGSSQANYNEMTIADYYNITFNNVSISQLSTFQGNVNDLNQLFDTSFTNTCNDPTGEAVDYESDDIEVSYFDNELAAVVVLNPNITVNINGVDVKIGDNLILLGYGNISFNSFLSSVDEDKIAIFKPEYEDSYVVFYFNSDTGIITEIRYMSPS